MNMLDHEFSLSFPAIQGVQAQRTYFVTMVPLHLVPKLFKFEDSTMKPGERAQRVLNNLRIPEMSRYVVENPESYVFSAITASVDGEIEFKPFTKEGEMQKLGVLTIDLNANFIINDGQHRRAAIEAALEENPSLRHETISVVLYRDQGLKRCQQMFADLNRNAIRPNNSIGVLYDHRDEIAYITRAIVGSIPLLADLVDLEKTSLSLRSRKLFTLSAFYSAIRTLLASFRGESKEKLESLGRDFWLEVCDVFEDWQLVFDRELVAGEIRNDFIHTHGVTLQAIGRVGSNLLRNHTDGWKDYIQKFRAIDWRRSNHEWEGRAFLAGRLQKGQANVVLTANLIKQKLNIELDPYEAGLESKTREAARS
jgi:DNA sulfur modification protein DndB